LLSGSRADFDRHHRAAVEVLNETPDRVPMTDFYLTGQGTESGFQARSVVGGVFMPMLQDQAMWKKWSGRSRPRSQSRQPIRGALPKRRSTRMTRFSRRSYSRLVTRNRVFVCRCVNTRASTACGRLAFRAPRQPRPSAALGLVMVEASAVSPEGRISPTTSGIWSRAWPGVSPHRVIHPRARRGAGHPTRSRGRKASTDAPWAAAANRSARTNGLAADSRPARFPFDAGYPVPREMTARDIDGGRAAVRDASRYSLDGGFEVVEYPYGARIILHEFLSPLSNHRTDDFGGSLANRTRVPLRPRKRCESVWPAKWPVLFASRDRLERRRWDLHSRWSSRAC
jgi:hypothetical protein